MRLRWPATLLASTLAGCGILPAPEAQPVDIEIEPGLGLQAAGDVVEVWTSEVDGETWRLVAFQSTDGDICLFEALETTTHHVGTCGGAPLVSGATIVGGFGTSSIADDEFLLTYGLVGPSVEQASVPSGDEAIDASVVSLRRLGADVGAMVVLAPATREPIVIELRDGSGVILEQFEIGPMP